MNTFLPPFLFPPKTPPVAQQQIPRGGEKLEFLQGPACLQHQITLFSTIKSDCGTFYYMKMTEVVGPLRGFQQVMASPSRHKGRKQTE